MNEVLKIIISLSFSGSFVIIAIFCCRFLMKDVMSRQWQYYLWLIAVARLLLPFAPQKSIAGMIFSQAEQQEQAAQGQEEEPHLDFAMSLEGGLSPDQSAAYSTDAGGVQNAGSGTDSVQDAAAGTDTSGRQDAAAGFNADPHAAVEPYPDETADADPGRHAGYGRNAVHGLMDALISSLWMVWFSVALALLIRRVTTYQSFVSCIKAGWKEVSDVRLLDQLAQAGEQTGIMRPVELYENQLVSTPMLIGFLKPCIILPDTDVPETEFLYMIRHELTHYKRQDVFYKWLVQAAVCIHWFNPFVWLIGREVSRACELACDEAVIRTLDMRERRLYGDTLLHAAGTGCKNSVTAITLCESAQLLKERLKAIMNFRKRTKLVTALSALLTSVLMTGAVSSGAYTGAVGRQDVLKDRSVKQKDTSSDQAFVQSGDSHEILPESGSGQDEDSKQSLKKKDVSSDFVRQCYEAGSIPLFRAAFPQLGKEGQQSWLDQCYADDNIAFFGAAVDSMDADSSLFASLAERAYEDGETAIFSILANYMTDQELENWLSKAIKDGDFAFQSILYHVTSGDDIDEKQEEIKKKLEKQMLKKYKAFGITKKGKSYFYKGDLVKILYDASTGGSMVHTLVINPKGTVNVRITRDSDTEIKNVGYMSSREEEKLLQQMGVMEGMEEKEVTTVRKEKS